MKKIFRYAAIAAVSMIFLAPTQAGAATPLDKAVKRTQTTASRLARVQGDSVVPATPGIYVSNRLEEWIDVVPVALHARPTDNAYGNARLVLKVRMKTDKDKVAIGTDIHGHRMIAVDADGNKYDVMASGTKKYAAPRDQWVEIVLDDPDLLFRNISRRLTSMEMVKIGMKLDSSRQDNIIIRDIPIIWE